jgi:hypothetical protein
MFPFSFAGMNESSCPEMGSSSVLPSSSHEHSTDPGLKIMEKDESSKYTEDDLIVYHLRNRAITSHSILTPL